MPDPVTLFYGERRATRFEFKSEDAHHICRVMRHGVGDRIWAINGSGTAFEVELEKIGSRRVSGKIYAEIPHFNEPPRDIILLQGLILQSKMDWLVEKATEFGVTEIRPVATSSKVGPGRLRRWERLARSAAKQCLRGRIPNTLQPEAFDEAMASIPASSSRFLLDPDGTPDYNIEPASTDPIILAVGPEKGFADTQLAALEEHGFTRISLGIRRLRAETAAIAALALLQRHLAPAS